MSLGFNLLMILAYEGPYNGGYLFKNPIIQQSMCLGFLVHYGKTLQYPLLSFLFTLLLFCLCLVKIGFRVYSFWFCLNVHMLRTSKMKWNRTYKFQGFMFGGLSTKCFVFGIYVWSFDFLSAHWRSKTSYGKNMHLLLIMYIYIYI